MTPPTRSRHAAFRSAVLAALALAGLAACATPFGGTASRGTVSPKTMAACRQRADAVFDQQNRDAVYRADMYAASQRDAPFGGAGMAGNPSSGLSDRYARDTILDDCLNGTTSGADVTTGAPPPNAAPAPKQ
jgi:hypothetical protein